AAGALDASGEWSVDGTASTHAWLVHHGSVTSPEASRLVRGGRLVHRHDRTAKRLHDGDVTCAQVDALARAARGHEDLFDEHEETLLDIARDLPPEDFRIVMRRWRAIADDVDGGGKEPDAPWRKRRLHASKLDDGSVHLEGRLDPAAGGASPPPLTTSTDRPAARTPPRAKPRGEPLKERPGRAGEGAAP